jgi:HipA-like protein
VRPDARPLSPTMPVRLEPYEGSGLLPFFDNLLPEGAQFEILVRHRSLDPRDKFAVLLATLPSSIGDVQIHQEERIGTP